MRLVIDLDDTISVHRNRDFQNAKPIDATIEKIRKLKSDGWEIAIYSARGQNSCNGDLTLIEKRNRSQVEEWLAQHDVPYDCLVFGKPLGDIYVDDKGVSLDEFLQGEYCRLGGNSGATVTKAGRRVLKQCDTAQQEADWYKSAARIGLKVPKVNSVVLGKIDLEHIDGEPGNGRELSYSDICGIVSQILLMGFHKDGAIFDKTRYLEHLAAKLELAGWGGQFNRLFTYIAESRIEATFSHGDLTLSNIIFATDGIYLIDPSSRREFSSYMSDFAKLRFSLDGGESLLHGGKAPKAFSRALDDLDNVLGENNMLRTVKALEAAHWIRLVAHFEGQTERDCIRRSAKMLEAEI